MKLSHLSILNPNAKINFEADTNNNSELMYSENRLSSIYVVQDTMFLFKTSSFRKHKGTNNADLPNIRKLGSI